MKKRFKNFLKVATGILVIYCGVLVRYFQSLVGQITKRRLIIYICAEAVSMAEVESAGRRGGMW